MQGASGHHAASNPRRAAAAIASVRVRTPIGKEHGQVRFDRHVGVFERLEAACNGVMTGSILMSKTSRAS
jgi:HrpA-like RNA helicase